MGIEEALEPFKLDVSSSADLEEEVFVAPSGNFIQGDLDEVEGSRQLLLEAMHAEGYIRAKINREAVFNNHLFLTDVRPTKQQQDSLKIVSEAMNGTTYIHLPSNKLPAVVHVFNQTPDVLLSFVMEQY